MNWKDAQQGAGKGVAKHTGKTNEHFQRQYQIWLALGYMARLEMYSNRYDSTQDKNGWWNSGSLMVEWKRKAGNE